MHHQLNGTPDGLCEIIAVNGTTVYFRYVTGPKQGNQTFNSNGEHLKHVDASQEHSDVRTPIPFYSPLLICVSVLLFSE